MNKSHQSFAVGAVLALLLVACSGGGGGSSTPAAAVFAYVADYGSNTVSAYRITPGTGALTRIDCGGGAGCSGSDFAVGAYPYSVTVSPNNAYVYVANINSNDVSAYRITAGTGALTRINCGGGAGCSGSDFAAGTNPASVTVSPNNAYVYVANSGSNIDIGGVTAYRITAGTGALTRIDCGGGAGCSGSDFAAGTNPASVTVSPNGAYGYVANAGSQNVSAYRITASSGALTRIDCGGGAGCSGSDFAAADTPNSVTVDPSGAYAYVANINSNDVSAYRITAGTGALNRIDCGGGAGCSGSDFAAGAYPYSVTVSPNGAYAYVGNVGSQNVSAYRITAGTGALTRIDCGGGAGCSGSDFAAGNSPNSVTVDPSGAYAYVANTNSNDVSAYRITAGSGALTRIDCGGGAGCSGSDFAAGAYPYSVTTTR